MKKDIEVPAILMLAALPPDLFKKAIKETEKDDRTAYMKTLEVKYLHQALGFCFIWARSADGGDFWSNVHRDIYLEERGFDALGSLPIG